jgi:hypothetical protein
MTTRSTGNDSNYGGEMVSGKMLWLEQAAASSVGM